MTDTPGSSESVALTFGEELRRERELRGISLKEIADATKISKRFLEAIEKGDHKTLPAPVFTRGFVREYARYLGLRAEDFVSRYGQEAANEEARAEGNEPSPQHPQKPVRPVVDRPSKEIPRPYAKVDRNIIWFIVILAVILGVIWIVREQNRGRAAKAATAIPAEPAPAPVQPTATTTQPLDTAAAQVAPVSGLVMDVRVTRSSWVALEADGKTVVYEELKPGFQQTYRAEESFRFRTIGNAAGLELTLNGVRVPSLGDEGEVVKDRTFDLDYVRELTASQSTSRL